jgi:hypothetical protein
MPTYIFSYLQLSSAIFSYLQLQQLSQWLKPKDKRHLQGICDRRLFPAVTPLESLLEWLSFF